MSTHVHVWHGVLDGLAQCQCGETKPVEFYPWLN